MVEEAYSVVEDHPAEVTVMPKFDMSCHESTMSSKDVKSLALRHGIPLDLHPCASSKGWAIDQLPEEVIGIVSTVNLFRVFYKVSKQGHRFSFEKRVGKGAGGRVFRETFSGMKGWKKSILDVQKLTKRFIDLRPVPIGLLFRGGLATTWDFPGFHPIFEDTKGNVLVFPFLSGASIVQGTALSSKDLVAQHTTPLLLRKARAAAKRKESRKRVGDEGEGSKPKTKRKKVPAVRKGGSASSKNANKLVYNYIDIDNDHEETNSLWLESFVNQYGRDLNADKTKSNALTNPIALERAWFSLARWAMAQANNLERFENLQDDYTKLAEALRMSDTLEVELDKKDSALVYAERISVDRAAEKEKLVTQLSQAEIEKFDCIRKLLPIMKEYPYVKKIASGFCHSVADLLKAYPDPAPSSKTFVFSVEFCGGEKDERELLKIGEVGVVLFGGGEEEDMRILRRSEGFRREDVIEMEKNGVHI
ncbi:hypothetical protein Tco_1042458 [Tanacetum coccineum]|uniref:Uncharacterized protein n=1 Tax=Tanacetum coccineum TaxID=301880 RepID=A0ABQ5GJ53_9ASTR